MSSARAVTQIRPHHAGSEASDLIVNTPEDQREYMLEALWIQLDTAKTLCDRADCDNRLECLARVRLLECMARNIGRCLEEWG